MVITPENATRLSPVFKGKRGKLLLKLGLKLTGIDHVNDIHQWVEDQGIAPGPAFATALLEGLGVDFRIGHPERLEALPEGPFIVIANHIYGHLDGICLVDLLGHQRPGTKVMVNEMLMWIWGLAPNFISVNPVTNASSGTTATSINGVKNALNRGQAGPSASGTGRTPPSVSSARRTFPSCPSVFSTATPASTTRWASWTTASASCGCSTNCSTRRARIRA